MKYTTHTYRFGQIPKNVTDDIQNLLDEVVNLKIDQYWKNYENFKFSEEVAVSTQYNENGRIELFSSVHTRPFYPSHTYRLLTRFLRTPHGRLGGAKTNEGSQPSYIMLKQQIDLVNSLGAKFYFMSRQRTQMRWINFYLDGFNKEYDQSLVVSKQQYWVTDSKDPAKGAQTLIHPIQQIIPFKLI